MPSYASNQLLHWIYEKQVSSVDEMTNVRKEYRKELDTRLFFRRSSLITTKNASDGTIKKLLAWDDGVKQTETVMIPTKTRKTACVSSQVGCPVGCTFVLLG